MSKPPNKNQPAFDLVKQILSQDNLDTPNMSDKQYQFTVEVAKQVSEYYESIIGPMPGNVFWIDSLCRCVGCNNDVLKMFGLKSVDEFRGLSFEDMGRIGQWSAEATASFKEDTLEVLQTGKAKMAVEEPPIQHADGHTIYFMTSRVPLFDNSGNIVGVVGISVDITKRKEAEKQLRIAKEKSEESSRAKSEFIANMSHDIRTPLHSILGNAEILERKVYTPEQEEHIHGIMQAGKTLLKLVEDILDFSSLTSGQFEPVFEQFDLRELIEDCTSTIETQAKNKGIEVIIAYRSEIPHIVINDIRAIRRILINLLGNAIKFTKKGHILISVEAADITPDKTTLNIRVEDTGVGIAKTDLAHIFDRFYRVNPSYKGQHKGTGLGLAISKELAEKLGGSLTAHSILGTGTTFTCQMPFKRSEQPSDISPWEDQYPNVSILVIDDHDKRRHILKSQLAARHSSIVKSGQALQAITDANRAGIPFDIILIDDEVTHEPYDRLAKSIHDNRQLINNPMLVLCTTNGNGMTSPGFKKMGFYQKLIKPLRPSQFTHELVNLWEKWLNIKPGGTTDKQPKTMNVLLVEDEPLIQQFTKSILQDLYCQVTIAGTGAEALKFAENHHYDIVFMDVGLPDADGINIIRIIRGKEAANEHVPIIALTAHVADTDKQKCEDAGVDYFLKKPASFKDFEAILTQYR